MEREKGAFATPFSQRWDAGVFFSGCRDASQRLYLPGTLKTAGDRNGLGMSQHSGTCLVGCKREMKMRSKRIVVCAFPFAYCFIGWHITLNSASTCSTTHTHTPAKIQVHRADRAAV